MILLTFFSQIRHSLERKCNQRSRPISFFQTEWHLRYDCKPLHTIFMKHESHGVTSLYLRLCLTSKVDQNFKVVFIHFKGKSRRILAVTAYSTFRSTNVYYGVYSTNLRVSLYWLLSAGSASHVGNLTVLSAVHSPEVTCTRSAVKQCAVLK